MIIGIFLALVCSLPATGMIMIAISIIPMEIETLKTITGIVGLIMFYLMYIFVFSNKRE